VFPTMLWCCERREYVAPSFRHCKLDPVSSF
jgi:hypothetical protein